MPSTQADASPITKPICFVIMPFSDPPGYSQGHFKEVYEYLFKPAISDAGYQPVRCDEIINGNTIHNTMFKYLEQAEMVLCDLSSYNPNVLFELGKRHSNSMPFVLVQEQGQTRLFDLIEYQVIPYRKALHIGEVHADQKSITSAITQTAKAHTTETNMSTPILVPPLELRTEHYNDWDGPKMRKHFPSLQIEASSTAYLGYTSHDQLLKFVLHKREIFSRLSQNNPESNRRFVEETLDELSTLMRNFKAYGIHSATSNGTYTDVVNDTYTDAAAFEEILVDYIGDELIGFLCSAGTIKKLLLRNRDTATKVYAQAKLDELNDLIRSFERYCLTFDPQFYTTYKDAVTFRDTLFSFIQ